VLDSVQHYVHGLLDGLAMPQGVPGPLVAWITPPVQEKVKEPRAYIWGAEVDASQQTAPRGPGGFQFPWLIDIYAIYQDNPDDARKNEPFPKVITAIMKMFMTTPMPLFIDEDGNPVGPNATSATDTQIQAIGTRMRLTYPPEKMVQSMRQVWYTQLLRVDVKEVVMGLVRQ